MKRRIVYIKLFLFLLFICILIFITILIWQSDSMRSYNDTAVETNVNHSEIDLDNIPDYEYPNYTEMDRFRTKLYEENKTDIVMRFCGPFFFDEHEDNFVKDVSYKNKLFDCKDFFAYEPRDLNKSSKLFKFRDDSKVFVNSPNSKIDKEGEIYLIDQEYQFKDYNMTIKGTHGYYSETYCDLKLKNNNKIIFKYSTKAYYCGQMMTVEYEDKMLLILEYPNDSGLSSVANHRILFFDGMKLEDLGDFSMERDLHSRDFWVDENGDFNMAYYSGTHNNNIIGSSSNFITFIPRFLKISETDNKFSIYKDADISNEIKSFYNDQVSKVKGVIERNHAIAKDDGQYYHDTRINTCTFYKEISNILSQNKELSICE